MFFTKANPTSDEAVEATEDWIEDAMTHTQAHMWHPTLPTQIDMDVRAKNCDSFIYPYERSLYIYHILTYEKSSYDASKPFHLKVRMSEKRYTLSVFF